MKTATINLHTINYENKIEICAANGDSILVKEMILFDEKEKFALSLAEATIAIDGETGATYTSYQYDVVYAFLFAKYYTNIDVSDFDSDEGHRKLYDYISRIDLMNVAKANSSTLINDLDLVNKMYSLLFDAMIKISQERNSLAHKIKTTFASVLSDDDLAESLAKSNIVNEKMINILGLLMGGNEHKLLPVKVGNNVVKFSKK